MIVSAVNQKLKFVVQGINQYVDTWVKGFCYCFLHLSGRLSTAAIIGICTAAAFAILIVVGVVVYWKKYHHRSRLRAAYYNDISMHDPLYEDFGPEVA